MSDSLSALLLSAALLCSFAGMGWLALSMQVHARQAWGGVPTSSISHVLRGMGVAGLIAALLLCLSVDHASMASLVWVMSLAGAALFNAFLLSWRPHYLRVLAPWVRTSRSADGTHARKRPHSSDRR